MVYHFPIPTKIAVETQNHFRERRYTAIKKAIKNLSQDVKVAEIEGQPLQTATAIRDEINKVFNVITAAMNDAPHQRARNRYLAWANLLTNDYNDIENYRAQLRENMDVIVINE